MDVVGHDGPAGHPASDADRRRELLRRLLATAAAVDVDPMPDWVEDAACDTMDADEFFPAQRHQADAELVATCHRCPVQEPCLAYAYAHGLEHGIYGGLTARQRATMTLPEALRAAGLD